MTIRIANAPVSFGVFEMTIDLLDLPDGAELARIIAEAGYAGTELGPPGYFGEGAEVAALLAEQMDTSLLGLCFDTGHSAFGGGDPLALLQDYGELVTHVHLKDVDLAKLRAVHETGGGLMRAWESGVFCPLGTGDARVEECLAALRDRGYDDWIVVEQDRVLAPAEPFAQVVDDARANREWLAERGL